MVVERLSTIFGKEQGETPEAERLHEQLLQTLTKEQRCLLLHLIDEKDMERGLAQEQNFAAGLTLGLRLGWRYFAATKRKAAGRKRPA